MTQADDQQRIAREEEYWNAPRLFTLGFVFLGVCLVIIYVAATVSFALTTG